MNTQTLTIKTIKFAELNGINRTSVETLLTNLESAQLKGLTPGQIENVFYVEVGKLGKENEKISIHLLSQLVSSVINLMK